MTDRPDDARRIAFALTHALQAARLYPAGHELRDRRRGELAQALERATDRDEAVEIDVRARVLSLGDAERVSLAEEPCRLLADAAEGAGLRRVVLPVSEALQRAEDLLALLVEGSRSPGEQSTRPVAKIQGRDRDPIEDLFDDARRAASKGTAGKPAEDPVCPDAGSLTGRLEEIWRGVFLARRLDPESLHGLADELASQTNEAHLEPVILVPGRDPREAMIAQALNASRLFWMCLRAEGRDPGESLGLLEASLLVDVGMLGVPPEVVAHEGRLDRGGFEIIARHPGDGARMLLATPGAPLVSGVIAYEHHMRRAGRGYPRAHGWCVSPVSALYQVCDTYAALRSERAHRPAFVEDEARELVRQMADTWLDGRWVALLLDGAAPEGARTQSEESIRELEVPVGADSAGNAS